MSRATITSAFRAAAFAQQTDQVFLVLLTINHASLAEPIRVVNNYENVTHDSNTYIGFPFDIELPGDFEEALPSVRLTICNVDRQIVYAIRTLTGPPTIRIKVVLASAPEDVQAGPYVMTLREADYNSLTVSGTIMPEDVLNEVFPGDSFTPAVAPGLFA